MAAAVEGAYWYRLSSAMVTDDEAGDWSWWIEDLRVNEVRCASGLGDFEGQKELGSKVQLI